MLVVNKYILTNPLDQTRALGCSTDQTKNSVQNSHQIASISPYVRQNTDERDVDILVILRSSQISG